MSNYPVLKFKYSRIYNSVLKSYLKPEVLDVIPSYKEILERKEILEKYWEQKGKKVLKSIMKTSGLKWRIKEIPIYLTSCSKTFSDPLTLSCMNIDGKGERDLVIDLIHELIHTILVDNRNPESEYYKWIEKEYPEEEDVIKTHIAVHAIQTGVFLDLGMEKELKERISKAKQYSKSWDIVENEGWKEIINRLRK